MWKVWLAPGIHLLHQKKWQGVLVMLFHIGMLICSVYVMYHIDWVPDHYRWANITWNLTYGAGWNGLYYLLGFLGISLLIRYIVTKNTSRDSITTRSSMLSVWLSVLYALIMLGFYTTGHLYSSSLLNLRASTFVKEHYQEKLASQWDEEVVFDYRGAKRNMYDADKWITLEFEVYPASRQSTPSHIHDNRENGHLYVHVGLNFLQFSLESGVLLVDGDRPVLLDGNNLEKQITQAMGYNTTDYERQYALGALFSDQNFWEYIRPFFAESYSVESHLYRPEEEIHQCSSASNAGNFSGDTAGEVINCEMRFQITHYNFNLVQENFLHAGEVIATFDVNNWYYVPTSIRVAFEGKEPVIIK